jgi:hypothetical protein
VSESPADPVAAYLAEVRERTDWVRKCEQSTASDAPYTLSVARRNSARDIRPLLAAVEAAVALHFRTEPWPGRYCCNGCGGHWPCPTYRAVAPALLGKREASRG